MQTCDLPQNASGSGPENDRALSVRDASRVSGLPAHTLRRLELAGDLESYRIGRAVFLSERSLKALLERARVAAHKATPQGCPSVATGGAR
jgi:hypothetical protein